MNLNEYQKMAQRTDATNNDDDKAVNAKLGLIGESGEVVDELKKWMFQSGSMAIPDAKLVEELGDVMWYCAALLTANHADMDDIFAFAKEAGSVNQVNDETIVAESVNLVGMCVEISRLENADEQNAFVGIIIQVVDSMCEALGYSLTECCQKNIAKLKKRYPDGFDVEKSLHRHE